MDRRVFGSPLAFVIIAAFALILCFAAQARAEGERLDRLQAQAPRTKPSKKNHVDARRIKKGVIAEQLLKSNAELDAAKAAVWANFIMDASDEFGVDPFMISAIIVKESGAQSNVRSRTSHGLMQINWKAHRTGLTSSFSGIDSRTDIYDPKKNILAGTYIFSCYLRSSGGDVQKALKRYVGGNAPRYVSGVINCRKELDTRFAQHINKVN